MPKYKPQGGRFGSYLLHSSGELEARRMRVAEAYFQDGKRVEDIAKEEGVSMGAIYYDIKCIREEYYESRLAKTTDWIKDQLAKLDFIEDQAMEAWFRSIGKSTKTSKEKNASGAVVKEFVTEEELVGDPRFLVQMQQVIDRRAKLLGLDAPQTLLVDTMEGKLTTLIREGKITFEMLSQEVGEKLAARYFNQAGKELPRIIEGEIIEDDDDEGRWE